MKDREVWIDWLRVSACFLVLMTHANEPLYFGGEGALILTESDAFWLSILNVITRPCVPLFVVASSYLLFPLRYSSGEFLRKRATRVLVPFLMWTVIYAFAWGDPVQNFSNLFLNFNYSSAHLWFVYMLIGLYLLMPMLSPWAEKVGKRELQVYLAIWGFTTLIPLIRHWAGGEMPVVAGPTGIPNMAKYPLWGECSWNPYGVFYYISGFIGYMLLGLYFRRFVGKLSWKRTMAIALPLFLVGFSIASFGFMHNVMSTAEAGFPVGGKVSLAAFWEVFWINDTIGVALMTIALILLFRKITSSGAFYSKVLLPVSNASYGMYLCHMFVLLPVSNWMREWLGIGNEGVLGFWTSPVQVLSVSILSYVVVAMVSVVVQKIPKIGKWVMG